MYYKYQLRAEVDSAIDATVGVVFKVVLKEKMLFELADCYFFIEKNHDHTFDISDSIVVCCYLLYVNENEALIKMKNAIDFFVFLTGIPFDTEGFMEVSKEKNLPQLNMNLSKKKMLEIQKLNQAYSQIRTKKELMLNELHLYAMGVKFNFLFGEPESEDAFLVFFRVIENIVKDEFIIEKNKISAGKKITQKYIKDLFDKEYHIQTNQKRLEDISGKIMSLVFSETFDSMFHKLIWYMQRKKINVDIEMVSQIVEIRNAIAHGSLISFADYPGTYTYLLKLTRKVIQTKFFHQLNVVSIDSELKVI